MPGPQNEPPCDDWHARLLAAVALGIVVALILSGHIK
jgi:hypothetical protein